jgi:hypothetical protein
MIDIHLIRDTSRFALADLACRMGLDADQYKAHLVQCGKDREANGVAKINAEVQRQRMNKAAAQVQRVKSKAAEQRLSYNRVRDDEYARLQALWKTKSGKAPTRNKLYDIFEEARRYADEHAMDALDAV